MSYSEEWKRAGWNLRPYGGVFDMLPGDREVDAAINDAAFVQFVATFEAAVARSQSAHGDIPADVGGALYDTLLQLFMDLGKIGVYAERSATPIIEIVKQIKDAVGPPYAQYVHKGLTSQDCVDTAMSMMQARVLDIVGPRLALAFTRLTELAEHHKATPVVARTLGQAAAPITFGWKVCGWIEGLQQVAFHLGRIRESLPVQIGGAAGDIADLGANPQLLIGEIAESLGLRSPRMPWHTERSRVLAAAAVYVQVLNACAKIATDAISMTSTDIGELHLGRDHKQADRGGSSAMPHKRNPAAAILIKSAATQGAGLLGAIAASGVHEHERAAGSWQAEWRPLRELMHLMGGATLELVLLIQDLEVDADRMRENLVRADVGDDATAALARCEEYLERSRH